MKILKNYPLYSFFLVLGLAFSLSLVGQFAFAQGPNVPPPADGNLNAPNRHDRPMSPPALTPEQKAQRDKLFDDFHTKARPLLANLHDQRLYYEALVGNPNATPDDIRNIIAEMRKSRDALYQLRTDFKGQYEKSGLPGHGFWGFNDGHDFWDFNDGCGGRDNFHRGKSKNHGYKNRPDGDGPRHGGKSRHRGGVPY